MAKSKKKKPWSVFLAIIFAIIIGSQTDVDFQILGFKPYPVYEVVGKLFINALTLVVVPLIASSIISGIARIGSDKDFSRLGAKTFSFYFGTSLIAIFTGLFFINFFQPGHSYSAISHSMLGSAELEALQSNLSNSDGSHFIEMIMKIVPSNIINAFSTGNLLGLIFFCILFGFSISKIESKLSTTLVDFFQGIFQSMIEVTHLIMKLLPIGVFCLVAKVFVTSGLETLQSLGMFFLTVMSGFAVFAFIALPLMLKFIGKVSPLRAYKAMWPALVTAFSTSSSSATLPITMECVEKRAGVSNRIASLVVPLGTSINMSGSALYECAAAMFVAQVYGIEIPFMTQLLLVFVSLLTSMGVAGIPSGSLVAIVIILKSMGLPLEGMGLFFAIDRFIDMSRTAVNVFSDSVCAILVACTEGEKDVLGDHLFIEGPETTTLESPS